MAETLSEVNVNAAEAAKNVHVRVRVTHGRRVSLRAWLAGQLLGLHALVSPFDTEIVVVDSHKE